MRSFKNWLEAEVVFRKDLTKDLAIMRFSPQFPTLFIAGQYCTIGLWGDEFVGEKQEAVSKFIPRPYSIVSAPHEELLELFLELVPPKFQTNGSLTPRLWRLKTGDKVLLSPKIIGKFILDSAAEKHVMVSTVTGVAPFVSMARARIAGRKIPFSGPLYIFQGASRADEFGYFEELKNAEAAGYVVYVPTVSRPYGSGKPGSGRNRNWKGKTGRVNEILDEEFKRLGITPEASTQIYICGNEGMIDDLARGRGHRKLKDGETPGRLFDAGFKIMEEVFF